ncbi:hypothetical protein D6Z43_09900 [Pseudomonas sp. DY-1]|uniref:hypothetical protein n=1 Tax=Pseudomonas sp. DY-1 TaxID=1755504 RepID=UPI000EA97D02|nr:hypothetical protein [Pseudomonas sp. DY-1]AYF87448.1 hypothetical protein D6Z43_09900 [Pseudomonas sp. DY-1]
MSTFRRKRDGALYRTDLVEREWPGWKTRGPCYVLRPVWDGRTHYKTVAAFVREFEEVSNG